MENVSIHAFILSLISQGIKGFGVGYMLGSIPFGWLLTYGFESRDLRTLGSGNIGATNVLRTGRKGLALATLLLDSFKGTAAVLLAGWSIGAYEAALGATLGACIGHNFPFWLKFKGGKGVATFLGCLFALHWGAALIFIGIWGFVAGVTRYSSLAALAASLAPPLIFYYRGALLDSVVFGSLTLLLWVRHIGNMARLWKGKESRIGERV